MGDKDLERIDRMMRRLGSGFYKLDADNRVVETDVWGWAEFFERHDNRVVGYTEINSEMLVSTIFLGLDSRVIGEGPPIVFETMIFGGPPELDRMMRRYSSYDDAETGHKAAVRQARAA